MVVKSPKRVVGLLKDGVEGIGRVDEMIIYQRGRNMA